MIIFGSTFISSNLYGFIYLSEKLKITIKVYDSKHCIQCKLFMFRHAFIMDF